MFDSQGKQSEEENNDESFVITGGLMRLSERCLAVLPENKMGPD